MVEEGNTANTYTIGGTDSVVEIIEIPSEIVGIEGADGAGASPVQDEGTQVVATPTALNFVGDGVVVTDVGGIATVTDCRRGSYPGADAFKLYCDFSR